jgi:hypothetical protein
LLRVWRQLNQFAPLSRIAFRTLEKSVKRLTNSALRAICGRSARAPTRDKERLFNTIASYRLSVNIMGERGAVSDAFADGVVGSVELPS